MAMGKTHLGCTCIKHRVASESISFSFCHNLGVTICTFYFQCYQDGIFLLRCYWSWLHQSNLKFMLLELTPDLHSMHCLQSLLSTAQPSFWKRSMGKLPEGKVTNKTCILRSWQETRPVAKLQPKGINMAKRQTGRQASELYKRGSCAQAYSGCSLSAAVCAAVHLFLYISCGHALG